MTEKKPNEERVDRIFKRLVQIEHALTDLHLAVGNLREERTALWDEYRGLIAADLEVKSEPAAVSSGVSG
jgi:hypothetical protein